MKNRNRLTPVFAILMLACLVPSSCTGMQAAPPTSTATRVPAATPIPTAIPIPTGTPFPLQALTLVPGEFYFRLDGQPGFVFSRNVAGYQEMHYETLLDWTAAGGSRIARISLDSMGMGLTSSGEVDEAWARQWEQVFDYAEANGIYILPVFSSWYDWNSGAGYSTWASNPLNAASGGPVQNPVDLFEAGSPTQVLWLAWMETLVQRWQGRENIAAWEIFSEVNLASNPTEAAGVDLVNRAAALIRAADPSGRPVTASIADCPPGSGACYWPDFYRQANIDFVELHPYPPSAQLDRTIVSEVRKSLARYHRPVLIGESGLSAETPDSSAGGATIKENAPLGIHHAIWAGIVSGAMNGRALWWEDGVGIYFYSLGIPWMQQYSTAELSAVRFMRGIDFSGFQPLTTATSSDIWGAAVGNESMVLGWYRDAASEPPDWNLQTIPAGQTVTVTVPGSAANWQVDFYDTKTGTDIVSSTTVTRKGDRVTITMPEFQDDIAFKMTAGAETSAITPEVVGNTDAIAGTWSGTISSSDGTFSTRLELSIQPGCEVGLVCGTFAVPQLPCSGALSLQEISGDTFTFVEQNATGAAFCVSGGYEYLQPLPDGTLSYTYSFTPGSTDTTSGILRRP